MNHWIDITVPLGTGMAHWPGDRPYETARSFDMERGDEMNLSSIALSAHTGTHMDAPLHFVRDGLPIDRIPLEVVIGTARVVAIRNPERICLEEVEACGVEKGERILFKTVNSDEPWHDRPFRESFVAIPADTARYLADRKPALVGVDYLSVGAFEGDGVETHQALLGAGIWLVEGLALAHVDPGRYELVCLPLKLAGVEGAPARAAIRRLWADTGRGGVA